MNALQLRQETLEVIVRPDSIIARDEAVAASKQITDVADEMDEADASDVLKELVRMERGVEDARKAIKAPLIDAGKRIDACSNQFCAPITDEVARLKGLLSRFDAARRARLAEEERKRQAEAQRIAQEKARAEAEFRRQQQEAAAAAEKARLAAEVEFLASDTAAQDKARQDAEEAQRRASEESVKSESARLAQAAADAAQLQLSVTKPVSAPAKPKGISGRKRWKFEVLNIAELYRNHPEMVTMEPRSREIEAALKEGKTIQGIRAWEETEIGVRV